MDGDDRGQRQASAAARRDLSGIVTGRRWAVPVSRRARAPAMDRPHAEGIQRGFSRVAVCGARVVGGAGAEPRLAVRRAEHAGYSEWRSPAAALLRLAGVTPHTTRMSTRSRSRRLTNRE